MEVKQVQRVQSWPEGLPARILGPAGPQDKYHILYIMSMYYVYCIMYHILYRIHIGGRVGVVRCQGWGGQGAEGGHRLIPAPLLRDEDRHHCAPFIFRYFYLSHEIFQGPGLLKAPLNT